MSQDYFQKRCEPREDREELREKIIGLGEKSLRKSYYPELKKKLADLERFKTLLDYSNDAVFLIEIPSGRFTDMTKSACRQIEYTRDACMSITMFDLIPDSANELSGLMSGKMESVTLDTTLVKGGGQRVPYEVDMRRVRSGNRDYVVAIARDITGRKRMEESLRLTQFALDKFSDSVIWLSPDGKFVYVNETACKRLGYSQDELLSMHVWDIDPDYPPERFREAWKTVISEGGNMTIETRHITSSGSAFPVEIACSYICYGNKEYMITIDRDVTERKQTEEERERLLQEIDGQRRHLQTILDTLPVGLFIMDTRGRTTFANRVAHTFWGDRFPAGVEELMKTRMWWADTGKPVEGETGLLRALSKGETIEREVIQIERQDGACAIILSSAAPMYDARGHITGVMVVSQDITEMRRLEKERNVSRQQAELYLDLLSHDITNMNQALLGYLEIIGAMGESGQFDRGLIDNAIGTINRSTRMIEDVKKLTRLQAGKVPLTKVNLQDMLSAAIKKYSSVPDRAVTINYTPGPGCTLRASDLLRDVFDKLLDNAIRHTSGPVIIDIAMDRVTQEDRPYCRVTVADNGPGIPPDLKRKIFMTPMEDSEKAARRGFGIYMARTLIDYYHGRIWVEDRVPGDYTKGAKFVVLLPRDTS